jgi:hypothetical protein
MRGAPRTAPAWLPTLEMFPGLSRLRPIGPNNPAMGRAVSPRPPTVHTCKPAAQAADMTKQTSPDSRPSTSAGRASRVIGSSPRSVPTSAPHRRPRATRTQPFGPRRAGRCDVLKHAPGILVHRRRGNHPRQDLSLNWPHRAEQLQLGSQIVQDGAFVNPGQIRASSDDTYTTGNLQQQAGGVLFVMERTLYI